MIEVTGLSKRYGTYLAVKDVSFSIEKGEVIGFLGPNGAGKSTIMNILTGYLSLTQGKVEIDGYDIAESPEDAKRRIGYLPEIPPLYTDMKVREYLIDSYKSPVVAEALKACADLVNDVWGLKYDRKVADLIAQYKVPCCLMHNREKAEYNNFLDEFCEDMRGCLSIAKEAGIADDQIILDPGVGFGKNYEHNLTIIHHLERLCDMGYPVLLATSRKSCIGQALDLPTDQRVEGTMVTTVMGVLKGAAFVRVHDVKENLRAIRMTQAILRDGRNG